MAQEPSIGETGEFPLIARLQEVLEQEGAQAEGTILGIGDDAAVLRPARGCEVLVTCDSLVEGRHYRGEFSAGEELGRRVAQVNLSDIGAMGGTPRWAAVSLGLRSDTPVARVEALYRGLARALAEHGAAVIGGNITRVEGAEFVDLTLVGQVEAGRAVRRSGARPGDALLVTGYPGQAAAGLRLLQEGKRRGILVDAYRRPTARVRQGRAAAATGRVRAMIDLSDGLAGDLGHICRESGVGARLLADKLPLSAALRRVAAAWDEDAVDLLFCPSDDYELLLTCAQEDAGEVRKALEGEGEVAVSQIGEITAEKGVCALLHEGVEGPLPGRGWDHFAE